MHPHTSCDLIVGFFQVNEYQVDSLLLFLILLHGQTKHRYSISSAPSWHEPELFFTDGSHFPQSLVYNDHPDLHCVRHQFYPSVIAAILIVAFLLVGGSDGAKYLHYFKTLSKS